MNSFTMLLLVIGLSTLSAVLVLARKVSLQEVFTLPVLLKIGLVAMLVTGLCTFYHFSRGSGMGIRTEYGFPRGYFWVWESIEGAEGFTKVKWRYLLENIALYFSLGSVVYVLATHYLRART